MQNFGAVGAVVSVVGIAAVGYFLQWSNRKNRTPSVPTSLSNQSINHQAIASSRNIQESAADGFGNSPSVMVLEPPDAARSISAVQPHLRSDSPDICKTTKDALHQVISQVVLPIVIVSALWKVQFSREYLEIPLYLGGINLALWIIVHYFSRSKSQAACSAFGNVTYVGLPILSGLYGLTDQVIVTIGLCEITTTLLNILTSNGRDRRFLKNPCLWAIVAGLALRIFPYPQFIDPWVKNLAIWMSLSMIMVLGMTIRLSMQWNKRLWMICGVKLIVVPAAMAMISKNPMLVLEAAMPCQLLTTVLYKDSDVSDYCFASILLSLITIPIWSTVIH